MTNVRLVYITVANKNQGMTIGRTLVEKRLAACVNLIAGMTSIYRWQGQIETSDEMVLIAKTTGSYVDALLEEVKKAHSYDCPCAIVLPVESGLPDYLNWLSEQLEP